MIVDPKLVKFADGTTFRFVGDSAAEFILTPSFLKYIMICVLMFALLQTRTDLAFLDPWELALLWLVVGLVSILWLAMAIWTLLVLHRLRLLRTIYTPFISLPIVVISETTVQIVLRYLLGEPLPMPSSRLNMLCNP